MEIYNMNVRRSNTDESTELKGLFKEQIHERREK